MGLSHIAAPLIKAHHSLHILRDMSGRDNLDDVSTVVQTLLDN
jgi:hypothetical protein